MEFKEPFEFAKIDEATYAKTCANDQEELHPELNGRRIRDTVSTHIFCVLEGKKCYIPNPPIYNKVFRDWKDIIEFGHNECNLIPEGPAFDDDSVIFKSDKSGVIYLLYNGTKHYIRTPKVLTYCHFAECIVVPEPFVRAIPSGFDINYGN